jgi:predicted Zn-dependent protease
MFNLKHLRRTKPAPREYQLSRVLVIVGVWAGLFLGGCDLPLPPPPEGSGQRTDEGQGAGEGPGRRTQHLALSPGEEFALGKQAYQQTLRENRNKILPQNSPEVRRVRTIASKIVQAVGIEPLQDEINLKVQGYRFEWEVNVIDSPQVNAFCLPGGKIVVYTGILPVAKNDDQLATVLSHEIAHALAHHSNERIARDQAGNVSVLQGKAYDRAQESEADKIGLYLMTFAGYNPDETVRFWERMSEKMRGASRPPEFLSDHPSDERRIHDLQSWLPNVKRGKQEFDAGHIYRKPRKAA